MAKKSAYNRELEKLANHSNIQHNSPVAGYNGLTDTSDGNYVYTAERGLHKPSEPKKNLSQANNQDELRVQAPRPTMARPKVKIVGAKYRKPLTPQSMTGDSN
jgi:hypothetical protein